MRIHIFGASGSGVTTLGDELAQVLSIPQFDADEYYWKKTDPPFTTKNAIEERHRLLLKDINGQNKWILTGSMDAWAEPFLPLFQLAIFLYVPSDIRVGRIKKRESERHGDRILHGGDMRDGHVDFIEWAAQYDEGIRTGRSLKRHEDFMKTLTCPMLRIEGEFSKDSLVKKSQAKILELGLTTKK